MTTARMCIPSGLAIILLAVAGSAFAGSGREPRAAVAVEPVIVAQGKIDLEAPPADYSAPEKEKDRFDPEEDAAKIKPAAPGLSLSVSGAVGAEVTSTVGSTGTPHRK